MPVSNLRNIQYLLCSMQWQSLLSQETAGPLRSEWYIISQQCDNTFSRLPLLSEQRLHTYINEFFISLQKKNLAYLICKTLTSTSQGTLTVHSKISTTSQCAANSDKYNIKSKEFHRTIFEHKSNQYLIKEDVITASFKGIQI